MDIIAASDPTKAAIQRSIDRVWGFFHLPKSEYTYLWVLRFGWSYHDEFYVLWVNFY